MINGCVYCKSAVVFFVVIYSRKYNFTYLHAAVCDIMFTSGACYLL